MSLPPDREGPSFLKKLKGLKEDVTSKLSSKSLFSSRSPGSRAKGLPPSITDIASPVLPVNLSPSHTDLTLGDESMSRVPNSMAPSLSSPPLVDVESPIITFTAPSMMDGHHTVTLDGDKDGAGGGRESDAQPQIADLMRPRHTATSDLSVDPFDAGSSLGSAGLATSIPDPDRLSLTRPQSVALVPARPSSVLARMVSVPSDLPHNVNILGGSFTNAEGDVNIHNVYNVQVNTSPEMTSQEKLFERHLNASWPRSRKAPYNADLGETATLTRDACTPGTRIEILDRICRWAVDSSTHSPSVFWLTGEAGSGKSTIAYTIAGHFNKGKNDTDLLGANFFCSRQFEETRRRKYLIPTIVYQLARKSRSYADALLRANMFDSVDIPAEQMQDLLVGPWKQSSSKQCSNHRPYLIVVDALDEIDSEGGSAFLRDLLTTIDKGHLRDLKFLVTSRPHPKLAELCSQLKSDAVCRLHEVPTDTVEADIKKYLAANLPALQNEPQLHELAQKADGLFIYAATAVRFICRRANLTKGEQLRLMYKLSDSVPPMSRSADTPSLIDALYQQILWSAFSELDDEDLFRDRLNVLHTLLCTEERVSTSVAGRLVSSDSVDMEDVAIAVTNDLHAVLYVKDGQVLWYHASFLDFVFTQARSKFKVSVASGTRNHVVDRIVDMSCNQETHNTFLAHSCFHIMKSELQFNICKLPSSFLLDSEVPDLSDRVRENISETLRYSARYWAQHLTRGTSKDCETRVCIHDFLRVPVLFWIEVMNLLGRTALCATILRQAHEWVLKGDNGHPSDLAGYITESASFATYFTGSQAAQSTPHLYISAVIMWSRDSMMSQMWKNQFSRGPAFTYTKGSSTIALVVIYNDRPVYCVAFSSDGTRIVSGSEDISVRVWDASTGAQLMILNGHTSCVRSVAFSSDGTRIVSGSEDKSVRLWDASTGAQLTTLNGHTSCVRSVAFSSDGTRIVSGSEDKSVRMWDASTGAQLATLNGHTSSVTSVAFSSDSIRVVSGSWDTSVRVWDALRGTKLMTLHGHTHVVLSVAFSSNGTRIVSGSMDHSVRVWDASTGVQVMTLNGHTNSVTSAIFSNDGTRIVSGSMDDSVRVWDASTCAQLITLNGHTRTVWSVAFSSDGTRIVSGSMDSSLRVWDALTDAQTTSANGHTAGVRSVAFSSDGTRIVSGSGDKSVCVWDASTGALLMTLNGHTSVVRSVALSSDGTRIVSGSWDESVRVWDASTGAQLMILNGHTQGVTSIAISSDGTRIVSGSKDISVRVWDASTGAQLMILNGHTEGVTSVAISSDGTRIVSGSEDISVRVWDASTGATLTTLAGCTGPMYSVALSRDGTRIVSDSSDDLLQVWDASTGARLMIVDVEGDLVPSVAFSSDGTRIVSGESDGSVRVCDASTGDQLMIMNSHVAPVTSVGFSNDGTLIVSGSDDCSVRVWRVGYHNHRWIIQDNWIVLSHPPNQRLMWVPPEIREVLRQPCNPLIISRKGSATVNFEYAKLGSEWAQCHTPVEI